MSKETKQDRIVRNILEQVTEHLHDLKTLETNPSCKELDVERWCQSFLRNGLGFTASSGYTIRAQESKGKSRPDLVVLQNEKPIFVVEVKKLGFDLNKSDFRSVKIQLNEYLNLIGNVKWGILTNGHEWKLFDFSHPQFNGVEVCSFDLHSENDSIDVSKKSVEDKCYSLNPQINSQRIHNNEFKQGIPQFIIFTLWVKLFLQQIFINDEVFVIMYNF